MNCHSNCSLPIVLCPVSLNRLKSVFSARIHNSVNMEHGQTTQLFFTHCSFFPCFESTKRWEWSFAANISYGECQKQNYEDTPNIGVKVFMCVTRDIFKPIMDFHSPSVYFKTYIKISEMLKCLCVTDDSPPYFLPSKDHNSAATHWMEIRPKRKGALVDQSNFVFSQKSVKVNLRYGMTKEFGTDF